MPSRESIDRAKELLPIPKLWRLLGLPGEPKACCRSPFRKEKKPSFSIFDRGRAAKDHGTGQKFDSPSFLAEARGLSIGQALAQFVRMAGGEAGSCEHPSPRERADSERWRKAVQTKPDLSKFWLPTKQEIREIAHDRGLCVAAPVIAARLNCLRCGYVAGYHSWILTDPAGWNAEARRFGRLPYPGYGQLSQRKAHTIRHSQKSWPLGLGVERTLVERASLICIVEGGPDYISAWHFLYLAKRWDVLPIATLGRAIHGLHPDALEMLKGKRIRFFPHLDPDQGALEQISLIGEQLRQVGCQLTYFDLQGMRTRVGALVKDLNDLARLSPGQSEELGDLFFVTPLSPKLETERTLDG